MSEKAMAKPPELTATAAISAILAFWCANWVSYKLTLKPFLYCLLSGWVGDWVSQIHDGLIACLLLWCLGASATGRLKQLALPLGILAFLVMLPRLVDTVFAFGTVCVAVPVAHEGPPITVDDLIRGAGPSVSNAISYPFAVAYRAVSESF